MERRPFLYILDEQGEPVPCEDVLAWSRWFEANMRQLLIVGTIVGNIAVSTIFLAINYNCWDNGPPILYETVVFGTDDERHDRRHCTRTEALAYHDQVVAELRSTRPHENEDI